LTLRISVESKQSQGEEEEFPLHREGTLLVSRRTGQTVEMTQYGTVARHRIHIPHTFKPQRQWHGEDDHHPRLSSNLHCSVWRDDKRILTFSRSEAELQQKRVVKVEVSTTKRAPTVSQPDASGPSKIEAT